MGDRLTKQTSPTPYGDIFDEFAPYYLMMGMTYEQYWDGESGMKKIIRKAYKLRMEEEERSADRQHWYMGQYIIAALQCVPLLVAGLNVKESTQLPSYPEKPFLEKVELEKKEQIRKKQEEDQTKLAMAMFQAGIEKFNRNFRKRQEEAERAGTGQ